MFSHRANKDAQASREWLKTVTSESEAMSERKFDSTYKPEDYSAVEKYVWKELIYSLPLSPCHVEIVEEEESGKVGFLGENLILILHLQLFVKKVINKDKLNDTTKAMARQECVIHSQMHHENIVQLYHFAESPSTIELVMEYCNHSTYFEDRLEEVSRTQLARISGTL